MKRLETKPLPAKPALGTSSGSFGAMAAGAASPWGSAPTQVTGGFPLPSPLGSSTPAPGPSSFLDEWLNKRRVSAPASSSMSKTAALPPQPDEALGPKQTKTSAESDQSVDNDKVRSKYPVKPNQVEVSKPSDEPPSKQPEKVVEETATENEPNSARRHK